MADNKQTPAISIIVRTKNRHRLLRRALASLAAQARKPDEIIVVNDGGKDVSAVTEEFKGTGIRLIQLGHSVGCPGAGNAGLEAAKGDYVGFLDDDDDYLPRHLLVLENALRETGADVVYSGCRVMSLSEVDPGGEPQKKAELFVFNEPFDAKRFRFHNYIPTICFLVSMRLLRAAGFLDERLHYSSDWDLLLRLAQMTAFFHVNEITSEYNFWEEETHITLDRNRTAWENDYRIFVKKNLLFLPQSELAEILISQWALSQERNVHLKSLEKDLAKLKSALADKNREILEKESVLAEKEGELAEKDREIRRFLDSWSWRLTAPLRKAYDALTDRRNSPKGSCE